MRVHVIYGQGGFVTSVGMYLLAKRIRAKYPKAVVTTWNWYDDNLIVADIVKNPDPKTMLIGYSLGANCTTWVTDRLGRKTFPLVVCYDPSRLSLVVQPDINIKRLLLYHNNGIEPEGHAMLTGPMVERYEINKLHLLICFDQFLHDRTMDAIDRVDQA